MDDPQPEGHMASYVGRRKFLATLGGAAAWPLTARAEEAVELSLSSLEPPVSHRSQSMKRRDVLPLLVGAMMAVPRGASAQTPAKTYRLASLTAGSPVPVKSPNGAMLFSALAKNGYTLGQNLEYQPYGAAMQLALLPQLAKDIAANKVDAAVVLGYPAA